MEPVTSTAAYRVGPFTIALHRHLVLQGDTPVALTAKAYETLVFLITHRDRVVTKEELIAAVWPDTFVSDDSLTHAVSALRKVLGDDAAQPLFIATIPRRGYRFVGAVESIDALPDEPRQLDASALSTPAMPPPRQAQQSRPLLRRWPLVSAAATLAVISLLLVFRPAMVAPRAIPAAAPVRFVQATPPGTRLASSGEISPDGRYLTFTAQDPDSGVTRLWLRELDDPRLRVLAGTDGATRPFWSPDSQSIGFFADGKLKRVDVEGMPPETLTSVGSRPSGGAWSASGLILYSDRMSQLYAIPEHGGKATNATELDAARSEYSHQNVHFLPDGKHYLFTALSNDTSQGGTYLGTLGSLTRVRLLDVDSSQAIYVEPGYLLFVRGNVLFAQRFDRDALRVTGSPAVVPTINAAGEEGEARVGSLSASNNGILVFGGARPRGHLQWYDRSGHELEALQTPSDLHNPQFSPDERMLIAEQIGGFGLWLIDLQRGATTRLAASGNLAAWSPDGMHVAFTERRNIHQRPVAGSEHAASLVTSDEMKATGNWSPDGRALVFTQDSGPTKQDIWVKAIGAAPPQAFLMSSANELQPRISPDGRWIAYASDESGSWEVYVQAFPVAGHKRTISVGGGAQPMWRGDGREIFYLTREGALMSVALRGDDLSPDKPRRLFRAATAPEIANYRNQYVVTTAGDRFIVGIVGERDPLNVVTNWTSLVNP